MTTGNVMAKGKFTEGEEFARKLDKLAEVAVRAWLDSLAQFSDKIPPLPKTISREWIYQEHD
jgi:hypothetical protein